MLNVSYYSIIKLPLATARAASCNWVAQVDGLVADKFLCFVRQFMFVKKS